MRQTTVRLRESAHDKLRELARAEARPMNDVLEDSIEAYRRARFLAEVNAGYAALREDPEGDQALREEYASLDGTLLDGLSSEEPATSSAPMAAAKPRRVRRPRARR